MNKDTDLDVIIRELSRHNFHHVNDTDPLKSHSQEYCRVILELIANFQEEIEQLKRPRQDDSDILREWGAFRRALRQILFEADVPSNPGWSDQNVVDAFRKLVAEQSKPRTLSEIETHLAVVCTEAQAVQKDRDEIFEMNQTQARLLHEKNNRIIDLGKCIAIATDALLEIRDSIKWGKDTAIKRHISQLQETAEEALKDMIPFRWYPQGAVMLPPGGACPYCGEKR